MKDLTDRCKRICANTDNPCFIENKNQIICIADMLINKVCCIKEIIESAAKENKNEHLSYLLRQASKNIDELTNWIKFIQIAHDLRNLYSTFNATDERQERRKENRYPFPEIYQKYITMKIKVSGNFVPVLIIDFSPKGVKFKSHVPFDIDSINECTLSVSHTPAKECYFNLRIKYCRKHHGEFIAGGQIEEIAEDTPFDFFKEIKELIIETVIQKSKKETSGK